MGRRASEISRPTVPETGFRAGNLRFGGWMALVVAGCLMLGISPGLAAIDWKKPFEIASGDAVETLRTFTEQSGEQVVYPPREVRGIQTHAISGQFTPLGALEQMLSGTALCVLHDQRTGALAIKRNPAAEVDRSAARENQTDPATDRITAWRPFFLRRLNASLPPHERPAAAPPARTADDETIALGAFEVVMTQNKGYYLPNSGNALKTHETIMGIPQSVTVITRDLIDDIASFELSDLLNYVAVGNFQQGDSAYVRGNNANLITDGAGDGSPSMMPDAATIDSITIVRGPIGVLYGGNSSVTGSVVRQTRVPLHRAQTTVKGQVDERGFHRFELDDTGPLGKIGEVQFSYRLDLVHQGGPSFLRRVKQDRKIYFGVLQLKHRDTTLRVNAQYQDLLTPPHKNNPATPEGLPWLGAGRDESFFDAASMIPIRIKTFRLLWNQDLASDWAFAAYAGTSRYRYGPQSVLLLDQIDFQRQTIRLLARRNNAGVQAANAGADLTGRSIRLGREFRTSLGFTAWNSRRDPYDHFVNPDFGSQNADVGTPVKSGPAALGFDRLEIPFADVRRAMDRINNVPEDQYRITPTAQLGTLADTTEANIYFQQNVEVLPRRLTATAAVSRIVNRATLQNYSLTTRTTTFDNRNHRTLYRAGLVLNLTDSVVLYGVETTSVAFVNSTSRTASGEFIPPRNGVMREGGFKTSFLDGRISATASVYTTYYRNWAVSRTGGIVPEFGYNVFDLIKDSYIKGWDFSLAARPLPTWQLLFNCTAQDPRIQATNTRLPSSNRGSWSVFTSYKFTNDALHRFRIGGGANRFYSRLTSAGALILPDGTSGGSPAAGASGGQLNLADGTMTTAFIEYSPTARWSLKLNVNNVFDTVMVMGAQQWTAVDPSQPRTFSLIGTYQF